MVAFNLILFFIGCISLFIFGRYLFLNKEGNTIKSIAGLLVCLFSIVNVAGGIVKSSFKNEDFYKAQTKELGTVKYANANNIVSFCYVETESGNKIPLINGEGGTSDKLRKIFYMNVGRPKGGKKIMSYISGHPKSRVGQTVTVYYLKKKWLWVNVGQKISIFDRSMDDYDLDLLMKGGFKMELQEGHIEKTKGE